MSSKSGIIKRLASSCGVSQGKVHKILHELAVLGHNQIIDTGTFTIPRLARLRIHTKKVTKGRAIQYFGSNKIVVVKAKPERYIVKAFPVKATLDLAIKFAEESQGL